MSTNPRLGRVLLWFIVALVTIQTLAGALLINRQRDAHLQQATRTAGAELAMIGGLIREPLLRHDYATVSEFLEGWAASDPAMLRMQSSAANGFVIAQYADPSPPDAPQRLHLHRPLYDDAGTLLANLEVERDQSGMRRELDALGLQLVAGGIAITVLLGATLWLILSRLGLLPLQREVQQRRAAEQALRQHRDRLDQEVAQRTRALAAANQALRSSEARWRSLVKHAPDFIVSVDRELRVVFANRTPQGMPLTTWLGRRVGELVPESERQKVEAAMRYALRTRRPTQVEARAAGPHGETVWYAVHVGPLVEDDEVTSLTVIARDISERHLSEAALREKSRHLEATNEELEQLIHVLAHDLKGPLRAVSHLSTAMEEELAGHGGEEAQLLLRRMRSRVQRMHGLIDGVLEFTRTGRQGSQEAVRCRELVHEIAESYGLAPRFQVTVTGESGAFMTDRLHLRQVLANLIGNAVAHHHEGHGRIEVEVSRRGAGTLEFTVGDDGPGIPAAYRERVFGLFQTLTNRERKESTGIGLALVKKIVETRGGRVWIEDAPPPGTRIRFTWPCAETGIPAPAERLRASG